MNTKRPSGPGTRGPRRPANTRWDVARLSDQPPGHDTAEDRLATLLRQTEPSRGLDPGTRARVWYRLRARSPRRNTTPLFRWALVIVVLFSSGAVVAAAGLSRWWRPAATTIATDPQTTLVKKRPLARRQAPVEAPVVAPLPVEAPMPAVEAPMPAAEAPMPAAEAPMPAAAPVAAAAERPAAVAPAARPPAKLRLASKLAPAHHLRQPATSPPAAPPASPSSLFPAERPALEPRAFPPPPVPSPRRVAPAPAAAVAVRADGPLYTEAQMIKRALLQLRRDGDAEGALAQLDLYLQRFPSGALRHEANVARVDALLSLNRAPDALVALDRLVLSPRGRDQELQVIRGELRGELQAAGGCGGAIADFTQVLNRQAPAPLAERALYGRAACRLRRGNTSGGQRDLAEYLSRFPAGRFADEARAALPAGK